MRTTWKLFSNKTKPLTFLLALLFSTLIFSTPSYGEWTAVSESVSGNIFYMDFERIRNHDGYVYYWGLSDHLKPVAGGFLSGKRYHQGDCKLFRFKVLTYVFHKQPMGKDAGKSSSPKNPEWKYPSPGSINEIVLKAVCNH